MSITVECPSSIHPHIHKTVNYKKVLPHKPQPRAIEIIKRHTSSLQEETELLSVDSSVVELGVKEPGHEWWASVGVRLPLDEKDEADSLREGTHVTGSP